MERKKTFNLSKEELFIYIIYFVGIIGHLTPSLIVYMKMLTPFTLLLTGGVVFISTLNKSGSKFLVWAVVTYLITFTLEVVGVKTGIIFGSYWYGETLGLKFLNVPLIIGFNWILVILGAIILISKYVTKPVYISFISALLATLFDFFLEPIAIKLGYWNWTSVYVPIQNYMAWFIISLLFAILYFQMKVKVRNDLPAKFFLTQLVFFITLFFLMR